MKKNQKENSDTGQWLISNYKNSIMKDSLESKRLIDIKPSQVFRDKKGEGGSGYQKIPHILLETLYKLPLTQTEFKMLMMIIHRCFRWRGGWIECYYKRQEFIESLLMDERMVDSSIKSLQEKNIIKKVVNPNKKDQKKKILTDKKITFNIFFDTWDIKFYKGRGKDRQIDCEKTKKYKDFITTGILNLLTGIPQKKSVCLNHGPTTEIKPTTSTDLNCSTEDEEQRLLDELKSV